MAFISKMEHINIENYEMLNISFKSWFEIQIVKNILIFTCGKSWFDFKILWKISAKLKCKVSFGGSKAHVPCPNQEMNHNTRICIENPVGKKAKSLMSHKNVMQNFSSAKHINNNSVCRDSLKKKAVPAVLELH